MKIRFLYSFTIIQFVFLSFFCGNINSQNLSLPLHSENSLKLSSENNSLYKSPIQPFQVNWQFLDQVYDSVYKTDYYKTSIFQVKPIINNSIFIDFSENSFYQTANGFKILSPINSNLSLVVDYTYNHISLPHFAEAKVDSLLIIPHYSKAKQKNGNYYFHQVVAELNYRPTSFLNLSFGNKHSFLGNGIRSLFLSDNSGNYYSLKALVDVWNIKYLFQASFLRDINKTEQPYELKKKFGTFHFISWDITPKFNLNLFESVIWTPDDSTINRGYDINYLNPVVFLRPVEFSVGSPDNILLGLGSNIEILRNTLFYSQFILDEFNLSFIRETEKWWANKFGYQFGIKYWQKINHNSLILNLEHNWMRPFTYSHAYSSKSYGNMAQPLAHPLGANFREWVSRINFSKNRLFIENFFAFQQYATDSISTNYGNNIYKSNLSRSLDYGSEILQGIQNNTWLNQLTFSYLVFPQWFSFVDLNLTFKSQKFENSTKNNFYFSFGIRTGINRRNLFDSKY